MRPLNKGNVPLDDKGNTINPTDYKKWRKSLMTRIGYYCVYCNQPISSSLQVEHVIPKNPLPGYTPGDPLAWNNMLLACGPCNNAKSNSPVDANTYYLPEEHNTHLPFETVELPGHGSIHAIVKPRSGLNHDQQRKAERTIQLLKLSNFDERDNIVDLRSIRRRDAMIAVKAIKEQYDEAKGSPTFNSVIAALRVALQAKAIGFFSLWYDAFVDEPEVMRALISPIPIPGTSQECFNPAAGYQPIFRNPLRTNDPI
jgi:hypothetical protein